MDLHLRPAQSTVSTTRARGDRSDLEETVVHPLTDLNPDALRIELAYRRALLPPSAARRFRARGVQTAKVTREPARERTPSAPSEHE